MAIRRKKKKANRMQPNDYPIFSFRADADFKKKTMRRVDRIKAKFDKSSNDDMYIVNKNDILCEAIELGLAQLEKRKRWI